MEKMESRIVKNEKEKILIMMNLKIYHTRKISKRWVTTIKLFFIVLVTPKKIIINIYY